MLEISQNQYTASEFTRTDVRKIAQIARKNCRVLSYTVDGTEYLLQFIERSDWSRFRVDRMLKAPKPWGSLVISQEFKTIKSLQDFFEEVIEGTDTDEQISETR